MGLKEECGVVGIWRNREAAHLAYLSLYALQHRGQEACGLVTINDEDGVPKLLSHKSFGLVVDGFTKESLAKLPGDRAIGHVRYSTQGGRHVQNIQPFFYESVFGPLAVAHNGNLTNAKELRRELAAQGSIFQSTSDSEIFMHLIAHSKHPTMVERIAEMMTKIRGAYSLAILTPKALYAVRDPFGFRPLVLGRLGESWAIASETCAIDLIDAQFLREINPGEVLEVSDAGMTSRSPLPKSRHAFCAFEPIYFARPDSQQFGEEMYAQRKKIGRALAEESPAKADVVIAVPDSGVPLAVGFGEGAHLPVEIGLVRNHYVGRTFIEPQQNIRDFGVKLKLNPVASVLKDKRVVVVDDSLVRGTTSAKIIRMLRKSGAKEIHVRIGSPPITHSCFYGIDTRSRKELLAAQMDIQHICEMIGADSLAYLSIDGLKRALGDQGNYCFACFNGKYVENIFTDIPEQPTDVAGPGLRYPSVTR